MSDKGHKDFTTQIEEKVTPQSQKSTTDKIGQTATGLYDKGLSAVEDDSNKSTSQKAGEKVRSSTNDTEKSGKSLIDSAKDTFNSATETISNTASDAYKSVTEGANSTADKASEKTDKAADKASEKTS